MTTIDNSKIFLGGIFTDAEVKVAANTTYYAGTILGRNVSGDLVAFSSDNNVEASGRPGILYRTALHTCTRYRKRNRLGSNNNVPCL